MAIKTNDSHLSFLEFATKEKLEIIKEHGEPQITVACFRRLRWRNMFKLI